MKNTSSPHHRHSSPIGRPPKLGPIICAWVKQTPVWLRAVCDLISCFNNQGVKLTAYYVMVTMSAAKWNRCSASFQPSPSTGLPQLEGMLVESVCLPDVPSLRLQLWRKVSMSFMCNGKRKFFLGSRGQVWEGDYAILLVMKEIAPSAFGMENT